MPSREESRPQMDLAPWQSTCSVSARFGYELPPNTPITKCPSVTQQSSPLLPDSESQSPEWKDGSNAIPMSQHQEAQGRHLNAHERVKATDHVNGVLSSAPTGRSRLRLGHDVTQCHSALAQDLEQSALPWCALVLDPNLSPSVDIHHFHRPSRPAAVH